MDEKVHEADKIDDVMLPGFRFHPTDEELIAFYLKRKILQQSLPIELIKQVDIYKFDPWDLPKLASSGEKEWYFYCPRDRKYRNSTRPNRVTCAGFWKATGTDRPICSSDGTRCVGLKKSLVFYRGRAAKGIKTDWMMHEFRLPSVTDSIPSKKLLHKGYPANDAWVICRIFKKTSSMAQRALSYPWLNQVHEPIEPPFNQGSTSNNNSAQLSQDNLSCTTTEVGSTNMFSSLDHPIYKLITQTTSNHNNNNNNNMFPALDMSANVPKSTIDTSASYSSLLLNLSPVFPADVGKVDFGGSTQQMNGFPISAMLDMQGNMASGGAGSNHGGATTRSSPVFPFMFPALSWESPSCPSEVSASYSSNKCYT